MDRELVRDFIDKLGGPKAAAALAGVELASAKAWQSNRLAAFPSNTFVLFRDELRRLGHLADDEEPPASLWGMKLRRSKRLPSGRN